MPKPKIFYYNIFGQNAQTLLAVFSIGVRIWRVVGHVSPDEYVKELAECTGLEQLQFRGVRVFIRETW